MELTLMIVFLFLFLSSVGGQYLTLTYRILLTKLLWRPPTDPLTRIFWAGWGWWETVATVLVWIYDQTF